jgi:filamentous hemagglutinin family protein
MRFFMKKSCFLSLCPFFLFAGTLASIANPVGEAVKVGSAVFNRSSPGSLTIHQTTDKVVINWNSFSIGAGEITRFIQPNANSMALNRVLGGSPSAIYGTLEANGRVYVINPAGILVGPKGVINTHSFVGTTYDVDESSFLAGVGMRFAGDSTASVRNDGTITALGGDILLFAHTVENAVRSTRPRALLDSRRAARFSFNKAGPNASACSLAMSMRRGRQAA